MWAWLASMFGSAGSAAAAGGTAAAGAGAAGAGVTAGVGSAAAAGAGTAAASGAGAAAAGAGASAAGSAASAAGSALGGATSTGLGAAANTAGATGSQVGSTLQSLTTSAPATTSTAAPGLSFGASGGAVEGALAPSGSAGGATGAAANTTVSPMLKMFGMGGHSGGGTDNATAIPEASSQTAPASASQAASLTGDGGGPTTPQAGVFGAQVSQAATENLKSEFNVGNIMKSLMGDSESFGKLLGVDKDAANVYMQRLQRQNAEAAERQKKEREGLLNQQWRF